LEVIVMSFWTTLTSPLNTSLRAPLTSAASSDCDLIEIAAERSNASGLAADPTASPAVGAAGSSIGAARARSPAIT